MFNVLKQQLIKVLNQRGLKYKEEASDAGVLALGETTVVLGDLSQCAGREAVLEQVECLLSKVLERRKCFTTAKASDIYLMMVGPAGSHDLTDWEALAAEIERDDRLARKHLWLPATVNNPLCDNDFQAFIETTFLARPWTGDLGETDSLSLLTDDVGMPEGWGNALLDPEMEGQELVYALMKLEA